MGGIYRLLFTHVLRRVDAERAHLLAAAILGWIGRLPLLRRALRRLLGAPDPRLRVDVLGRSFPSPLGVAAGVDKNGTWFAGLAALGFGWVEVGTVTGRPQPGNPRPRVWRLPERRALLNAMGFPNDGAEAVAARLARRDRRPGAAVVGINLGKSKVVANEAAVADYRAGLRACGPHADFVVLNVSSPNTPGLRDLQAAASVRALVTGVREEMVALGLELPLLLKIAPDLADEAIDELADLAVEIGLDGIVATNTTVRRDGLPEAGDRPGGISGAPLKARSLEVLRRLHARVGGRGIVLVSVGGIETADDVLERLAAGASLVGAYTGFVYGGPLWPRRINRALAEHHSMAG